MSIETMDHRLQHPDFVLGCPQCAGRVVSSLAAYQRESGRLWRVARAAKAEHADCPYRREGGPVPCTVCVTVDELWAGSTSLAEGADEPQARTNP